MLVIDNVCFPDVSNIAAIHYTYEETRASMCIMIYTLDVEKPICVLHEASEEQYKQILDVIQKKERDKVHYIDSILHELKSIREALSLINHCKNVNGEKQKGTTIAWDAITILDVIRFSDISVRLKSNLATYCELKHTDKEYELFKYVDFELMKRVRNCGKRSIAEMKEFYYDLKEKGFLKI